MAVAISAGGAAAAAPAAAGGPGADRVAAAAQSAPAPISLLALELRIVEQLALVRGCDVSAVEEERAGCGGELPVEPAELVVAARRVAAGLGATLHPHDPDVVAACWFLDDAVKLVAERTGMRARRRRTT